MILTKIKRIIKAGLLNFWRDGWVSLATILIVVTALFSIGGVIFAKAILSSTLDEVQNKVDISVYFKIDTVEKDIVSLKNSLEKLGEVQVVEYVSREQALVDFKERHKENALIIQSLDELGENPLGGVLNIKAKQPSQYAGIAKFLEDRDKEDGVNSIIDKINYRQNKLIIDKLSKILESSKQLGFSVSLFLVLISILITFNTIRLAIYTNREEIGVMRLVGASNKFISGPFVITGVIYGLISSVVTMALFWPATKWTAVQTEGFFTGINIFKYYTTNFWQLFLILLSAGTILGVVSSFIAVRRYLKV